jgi:hypothetical protein
MRRPRRSRILAHDAFPQVWPTEGIAGTGNNLLDEDVLFMPSPLAGKGRRRLTR